MIRDHGGQRYHCHAVVAALALLVVELSDAREVLATSGSAAVQEYELHLHCLPSYLVSLPLVVEVELRNQGKAFEEIPFFDLVTSPSAVSFELTGRGRRWRWPERAPRARGNGAGVELRPGVRWSTLQDLSELHPDLPPGRYQLTASILLLGQQVQSAPTTIHIKPLPAKDRPIVNRLRPNGDQHQPSWLTFLTDNWRTLDASGLSAEARQHLAFQLFLHRAAYGPSPPAKLNADDTHLFARGIFAGWAALIRLEILCAAGRPEANALESELRKHSPEFTWWIDQVRAGAGLLARFRRLYGVESPYAPTDRPRPYNLDK